MGEGCCNPAHDLAMLGDQYGGIMDLDCRCRHSSTTSERQERENTQTPSKRVRIDEAAM